MGIADIVDDDVLHEVAELVRAKGRRASVHIADMSSVEQIGRAVDGFVAEHGTVDIVVNSTTISGYVESPGFWDTTEEFYDKQMDVHLKASFFLCTQPTLPPPAPTHSHTEGSEPPRARSFHPRGLCSSPRGQRDARARPRRQHHPHVLRRGLRRRAQREPHLDNPVRSHARQQISTGQGETLLWSPASHSLLGMSFASGTAARRRGCGGWSRASRRTWPALASEPTASHRSVLRAPPSCFRSLPHAVARAYG